MAGGDDDQFNQLRHDLNSLEESEEIIFTCSEESSFSDEDELKVSINKEDLSIKNLQIPNSSSSGEEERMMIRDGRRHHHHHHLASNEFPRICKVCKKGFSSGKALGGHSRIHAQPKKQSLLMIKRSLKFKKHHHHHHQSPGTPTTSTSTSTADCCNPNNGGRSRSSSSSSIMMKKMYNNNTCWVCEKSFPSEKSLFGHMRCHPDRTWRGIQPPNLPPTTVNKNMSSSSTLSEAEAIPRHKLDDHIDSATTTTIHPSVVVDLSRSLSGWSSTAKRGRKGTLSISAVGSGCPSGLDEQIPEDVVQNLMMLAQGHKSSLNLGLPSNKQPQQQLYQRVDVPKVTTMVNSSLTNMNDPQIEQVSGSKKTTKERIEASLPAGGYGYPAKKLKIEEEVFNSIMDKSNEIPVPLKNMDTEDSKDTDDFSASGDQLIYSCYRIINLKKKKRRTLKFRDLDTVGGFDQIHSNNPTVTTTDRYKCTTCNKTFPTHQALGGHRSSHNKVKNTPALVKDESAYAAHGLYADAEGERYHPNIHASAQVSQTDDEEAASSRLHHGGGPHQCKVCNKTFATGQALGGHKRCHWTGPIETPSSQVASSGEASHTSRRIPAFDLNELPAMEDEEGVESVFVQPQHSAG